jgi:hypothetical protein
MDQNTLADLKQFITVTVGQATARLATKEHTDEEINGLRAEMNRRFDGLQHDIAEALDVSNEIHGKQLKDHERRITKLEQQRAA